MEDMSIENLKSVLEFVKQLGGLSGGIMPDELCTKQILRSKWGVGENRANKIEETIRKKKMEHAINGRGVVAPASVWYEAMKSTK